MGGMKSDVWAAMNQRIINNVVAQGASASELRALQKEDMLNIFNSIRKQKLLRNVSIKNTKDNFM